MRRLTLRQRTVAALGAIALVVSSGIALSSYLLTRSTLVDQRERTAQRQAYLNARAVRGSLVSDREHPGDALARVQTAAGGLALVRFQGEWFSSSVAAGRADAPSSVLALADEGTASVQRVEWDGSIAVAVGVPLAGIDGTYVELAPFEEVSATLARVRSGLLIAVACATAIASAAGWWLSGRIMRPVLRTATAAREIKEGQLDRRLEDERDPGLRPLVTSFNDMVDGLQARIERESRFAADVTHELRSPLARMDAALSVARRRVKDPSAMEALDALGAEVQRFQELVVDLLEIGRAEAGVADVAIEQVDVVSLVQHVVDGRGDPEVPVVVEGTADRSVRADKRRLGQAVVNLLDNARNYGDGARAVRVELEATAVRIHVDDAGPGVPEHEREYVFQRFARGEGASTSGTGLGLALVAEHMRLHGGEASVSRSPEGGARFTLVLPRGDRG